MSRTYKVYLTEKGRDPDSYLVCRTPESLEAAKRVYKDRGPITIEEILEIPLDTSMEQ